MRNKLFLSALLTASVLLPLTVSAEINLYKNLWDEEASSTSLTPTNIDSVTPLSTTNRYANTHLGFSMDYPKTWSIDNHQASEYVRIYGDEFRIDFTYDNLAPLYTTFDKFVTSTLEGLQSVILTQTDWTASNGLEVHLVDYTRPKLSSMTNDLTAYTYFFIKSADSVYTIQLKTNDFNKTNKVSEVKSIISSMNINPITLEDVNASTNYPVISKVIEYVEPKNTMRIGKEQVTYGLFETTSTDVKTRETELGSNFGGQMFYKPIDSNFDFTIDGFASDGKTPLATFHFKSVQNPLNTNMTQEVINGVYDSNIISWANGIRDSQTPVFVRIANEMNGQWTEWSHMHTYNDPDLYKLAYRHVVDIYRSQGATNAKFVWNPNDDSDPNFSWNSAAVYYPGDNYVDWVGLTAYNFAKTSGEDFKYFDQLYEDIYFDYLRLYPNKPFMIGEFASVEKNGNKPFFIKDMFEKIPTKYPNIKYVIWFNLAVDEYNLPYQSSTASEKAFKDGLKHESVVQYSTYKTIPAGLVIITKNNSQTTQNNWTLTGVAKDPLIKEVYLNGDKQTFSSAGWRQFDKSFQLSTGLNTINIEIEYQDESRNTYPFYIYKKPSFQFTYAVGHTPTTAPTTSKSSYDVLGLIKDNYIQTLKINGMDVPIQYSWKQFYKSVPLQNGMNEINLLGFNASGVEVVNHKIYVFKENGISLTGITAKKFNIFNRLLSLNGTVDSSIFTNLKVGGMNQLVSNGAFTTALPLNPGNNSLFLDAIYQTTLNGNLIEYAIHEPYDVQTPIIDFSSKVGFTPETAGEFNGSEASIKGLVKDPKVKSIKINGEPVVFLYTWKQFAHDVTLSKGLNRFTITGYSDEAAQEKISEETVYLFNNSELIISTLKNGFGYTQNNQYTITGMASNPSITSVRINGVNQSLKWSWKQFDQTISLNGVGNNAVTIRATYEGIENGTPYQFEMNKDGIVHNPSFVFNMPYNYSIATAPQTSNSTQVISGTVIDTNVKSMKIGLVEVPINNTNKTFSYTVPLKTGLNAIKLVGYSDVNYETKIFEETLFFFNDNGFTITKPATVTSTVASRDVEFAGILGFDFYKSIKINSENIPFINEWRQFNKLYNLSPGDHLIKFEATWQHEYEGKPYTYIAKKEFTVTVPASIVSFEYSTDYSRAIENAPAVNKTSYWLGGFVKDSRIGAIKVNNEPVAIEYSWRQFGKTITSGRGLNTIRISGYKDNTYSELVEEETIYYYVPPELIPNFELTTPSSKTIETAPVLNKTGYWLGGLVKNPSIQSVKINGVVVPLQYSWRQFGTNVETVRGLNTITIQGYSDVSGTKLIEEENFYYYVPPEIFPDFEFTTAVGTTSSNPVTVTKPTYWLGGFVKDSTIKGVTVNGAATPILYSWKQIGHTFTLEPGLNEIIIKGYSDINLTKEVLTVRRYIFISPDQFINFDLASPLSDTSSNPVITTKQKYWIGGFAKNPKINSVKINGTPVEIKYSWRQIDYYADLKPGLNTITLTGYSDINYQNVLVTETKYVYISPDNFIDFKYSSTIGDAENSPHTVKEAKYFFGAYVKNNSIKSVKVNGTAIDIMYDWRQITSTITLKSGLNVITIIGYSDLYHQTEISRDVKYLYFSNYQ